MMRISFPTGLQQFFFAAGFTVLFWIVGRVGTDSLAAANVLINITLVAILPAIGLGLAAASLVGQALGRGEGEDARRWGWDVVKLGVLIVGVLGLPMWLFPEALLGIFLREEGPLALGRWPLRLVGLTIWVEAVGLILMNALLGAGDSRRVAVLSIALQWLVFLPAAYAVGPVYGGGLLGIWIAQLVYRAFLAGIFGFLWRSDGWQSVRV